MNKPKVASLGLALFIVIGSLAAVPLARVWRKGHYVIETSTCMRELMNALGADPAAAASPASLEAAARSFGVEHCLEDGWGRRFEIEAAPGSDPPFLLRSLGRDGKRGECCRVVTENWDDDAVLEGDRWLQAWNEFGW